MSLLREIRKQPDHIRAVFMWLCVIITGSVVGYLWMGMIGREFIAMVNPEADLRRNLAKEESKKNESDSAFITVNNAIANIGNLLGINNNKLPAYDGGTFGQEATPVEPQLFPLGGERKK